jgi:hypothetical protein
MQIKMHGNYNELIKEEEKGHMLSHETWPCFHLLCLADMRTHAMGGSTDTRQKMRNGP